MTKSEVYATLYEGKKLSLPEWIGYWFMVEGEIKVYSRDCKVLDTPYLWYLENRTDWIIVDGERDFSGILYALKAGKAVARKGWNGKGIYLIYVKSENNPFTTYGKVSPFIGIKTVQGTFEVGWRPTTVDMLAEDWIILD